MSNAVEPYVSTGPHVTDPSKRQFEGGYVPWQLLPPEVHQMIDAHLKAHDVHALKASGHQCPFGEAEDNPWRRSCSEGTPLAYHPFALMIESPCHNRQQKENMWKALSAREPWSKRVFDFLNSFPAHEKKLFEKLKAPEVNGLKVVDNTKVLDLPGGRQAIVDGRELSIREHSGKTVFKAELGCSVSEVVHMAYLEDTLFLKYNNDPWGYASIVFQPDFKALKAAVPKERVSCWPPTSRAMKVTSSIAVAVLALYGYAG